MIELKFEQTAFFLIQTSGYFAVIPKHRANRMVSRAICVDSFCNAAYLAKLLNAADCGFMQSGTRDVFSCSAINLCISSETDNEKCKHMRK